MCGKFLKLAAIFGVAAPLVITGCSKGSQGHAAREPNGVPGKGPEASVVDPESGWHK